MDGCARARPAALEPTRALQLAFWLRANECLLLPGSDRAARAGCPAHAALQQGRAAAVRGNLLGERRSARLDSRGSNRTFAGSVARARSPQSRTHRSEP